MGAFLGLVHGLGAVNAGLLALGRWLGAICVALMVVIILTQVFFRYGLGAALAWPEEAARFLMLWMTGLMAPTALRRGGFVAIELLVRTLPRIISLTLSITLLTLSLLVLLQGLRIGYAEVTGLGGRFAMDSLNIPASLDLSVWQKVPRGWMMASLVVGLALMVMVMVELILRSIAEILGAGAALRPIPDSVSMGAE
jgi:TRAP-type transport system small permease protein